MTTDRRTGWIVLAGLLACCAAGSAGAVDEPRVPPHGNPDGIRKLLLKKGDADSLAAASLVVYPRGPTPEERLAYAAEAARLAPGRADLAWLHYVMCAAGPSCDDEPLLAHLRAADPGNRAALGVAVHESARVGDAQGVTSALQAMGAPAAAGSADPPAFRVYWNPLVAHLSQALIQTHRATEHGLTTLVISELASLSWPAFGDVAKACKGDALLDADRLQACRDVSRVLRDGDSTLVEAVGLAIALRAWPADDPVAREAADRQRVLRYQTFVAGDETMRETTTDNGALRYLKRLAAYPREQESAAALLAELHKPLEPPEGWKDPLSR